MGRKIYDELMKKEFILVAKEKGIAPAIRELGYPAGYLTASRWFDEFNEERPTIDSLMQKASELKIFYSDNEKKAAVQELIDRIVEQLQIKELNADEINKLSNALNRAIQTFNLIEGKSTSINESRTKDGTDLAINDLLNSAKARADLMEKNINN